MPFKSLAEERWGNSPAGRRALGPKLAEFNAASKGLKLPERIGKPTGILKVKQPSKPRKRKMGLLGGI